MFVEMGNFVEMVNIVISQYSDKEKITQLRAIVKKNGKQILMLKNSAMENLLHYATPNCGVEVFKYLLKEAPQLFDERSLDGVHFIFSAAKFANVAVVKYAVKLKGGAEVVKSVDNVGNTSLIYAVKGGNRIIFDLFQKIRGDWCFIRDVNDITPAMLTELIEIGKPDLISYLIKQLKLSMEFLTQVLMNAALKNKMTTLRFLLEECRIYVDAQDEKGNTALLLAAAGGYPDMFDFLMAWNANIFHANNYHITPLHIIVNSLDRSLARQKLLRKIMGILLELCIKHNVSKNPIDKNPIERIRPAIYKELLSKMSKVGITPLMLAARKDNLVCARILVEYGADFFEFNKRSTFNAYHYAAAENAVSVLNYIILFLGNRDLMHVPTNDKHKNTALHIAVWCGAFGSGRILIDFGADAFNKPNQEGIHPVQYIMRTDTRLANFMLARASESQLSRLDTLPLFEKDTLELPLIMADFDPRVEYETPIFNVNLLKIFLVYGAMRPEFKRNYLERMMLIRITPQLNQVIFLLAFDWKQYNPAQDNFSHIIGLRCFSESKAGRLNKPMYFKKVSMLVIAIMIVSNDKPEETLESIIQYCSTKTKDDSILAMVFLGLISRLRENKQALVGLACAKRQFLGEEKKDNEGAYTLESKIDLVNIELIHECLHKLFFSETAMIYVLKRLIKKIPNDIFNHILSFLVHPEVGTYSRKTEEIPSMIRVRGQTLFDVAEVMLTRKVKEAKESKEETTVLKTWLDNQTDFYAKLRARSLRGKTPPIESEETLIREAEPESEIDPTILKRQRLSL